MGLESRSLPVTLVSNSIEFDGIRSQAGRNSFTRSNVSRFQEFYLSYLKCAKASHILSWSNHIELLKLDDSLERSVYDQPDIRERLINPIFNAVEFDGINGELRRESGE
jgi:hypothetical protein